MKKYIIPAVDVTALHVENSVLLDSVPVKEEETDVQLTRGWDANEWMTTETDE